MQLTLSIFFFCFPVFLYYTLFLFFFKKYPSIALVFGISLSLTVVSQFMLVFMATVN